MSYLHIFLLYGISRRISSDFSRLKSSQKCFYLIGSLGEGGDRGGEDGAPDVDGEEAGSVEVRVGEEGGAQTVLEGRVSGLYMTISRINHGDGDGDGGPADPFPAGHGSLGLGGPAFIRCHVIYAAGQPTFPPWPL